MKERGDMDDENRGVSGVKVLMKSNEFYSKTRDWLRISKQRISDVWHFLTPLLTPNVFFFPH